MTFGNLGTRRRTKMSNQARLNLRVPETLKNRVTTASNETGISENDLSKLFIRKGLDDLDSGEFTVRLQTGESPPPNPNGGS